MRLRIIAELTHGRVHVSELARRLGMSRPLLYMHLDKLEEAEMVTGHLELTGDGKAMKYFDLAPFELRVTAGTIAEALGRELTATISTWKRTADDRSACDGRRGHSGAS